MSQSITPEEAARVYLNAAARSRKPLQETADYFGVSQSTVTRRIAEARAAGLIPDDVRTTNPYLPAIADELGVTVRQIEDAVRKHAPDGNLRVKV